ncbi:MAG TPA: hypothetical protein PLR83_09055 [Pyrinomonadaceae bacterium]|nr:hypothetical protein [Pyrinomonadaceae bacterium]
MYRRPKFIEELHRIRQEMAAEADHDVILFAEKARSGEFAENLRLADFGDEAAAFDETNDAVLPKR